MIEGLEVFPVVRFLLLSVIASFTIVMASSVMNRDTSYIRTFLASLVAVYINLYWTVRVPYLFPYQYYLLSVLLWIIVLKFVLGEEWKYGTALGLTAFAAVYFTSYFFPFFL